MRKQRSDKGLRKGFNVSSKSTDQQIKDMIKKVNKTLGTYKVPSTSYLSADDTAAIAESAQSRVQNLLTFVKGDGKVEELTLKNGRIPLNKSSVAYIRQVLERQEQADERQKAKDPSYTPGKHLNRLLSDVPTLDKRLESIKTQLANPDKYEHVSTEDVKVVPVPQGEGRMRALRQNKKAAMIELAARSQWTPEDSLEDMIDKLYEDETKNADLLAELRGGKWTGDLLERANMRALGIEIEDV